MCGTRRFQLCSYSPISWKLSCNLQTRHNKPVYFVSVFPDLSYSSVNRQWKCHSLLSAAGYQIFGCAHSILRLSERISVSLLFTCLDSLFSSSMYFCSLGIKVRMLAFTCALKRMSVFQAYSPPTNNTCFTLQKLRSFHAVAAKPAAHKRTQRCALGSWH